VETFTVEPEDAVCTVVSTIELLGNCSGCEWKISWSIHSAESFLFNMCVIGSNTKMAHIPITGKKLQFVFCFFSIMLPININHMGEIQQSMAYSGILCLYFSTLIIRSNGQMVR